MHKDWENAQRRSAHLQIIAKQLSEAAKRFDGVSFEALLVDIEETAEELHEIYQDIEKASA